CWNKVRKQYQCPPRISCCAMRRYKARLTARPVSAMRKPMLSSSSESKVEGSVCADINLDWYLIKITEGTKDLTFYCNELVRVLHKIKALFKPETGPLIVVVYPLFRHRKRLSEK